VAELVRPSFVGKKGDSPRRFRIEVPDALRYSLQHIVNEIPTHQSLRILKTQEIRDQVQMLLNGHLKRCQGGLFLGSCDGHFELQERVRRPLIDVYDQKHGGDIHQPGVYPKICLSLETMVNRRMTWTLTINSRN
jgi:hypothetical protein